MTLPPDFQFSQAALQDYQTCARRFKLRYLDQLRWPAIESEPVEEAEMLAKLGTDFHHLVRQHLDYQQLSLEPLDVEAKLAAMLANHDSTKLQEWWDSYLAHLPPELLTAQIYPEVSFSTPCQGYRLTARFDVLAIQPDGQFVIIDWKTAQKKPSRARLTNRIQTKVYPYVLAQAGTALNQGQPIDPAAIKMIYWYPVEPTLPEVFTYSAAQRDRDEQFLNDLIEQLKGAMARQDFPLVTSSRPCQYCVYRSLCERGDRAGPVVDQEEEAEELLDVTALDWEQIAEIQF